MRSIVYTERGPSSVLHLVDRDPAEPGEGEVRVRIAVSGVNPTDWKSRAGATGGSLEAPSVPNQDGAGVIDAVGAGVDRFRVGDRVWTAMAAHAAPLGGTAQELTVLPAERVHPLPDGVSFDVGASLGVPALTAHRALTITEGLPERLAPGSLAGAVVLVAGGAGAVGHAAIQLARWAGATVVSTVSSPEKAALAEAAGAQHVLNYHDADTVDRIRGIAPDGVDTIVEVNAVANAELDGRVLRTGGAIAAYAANPGERYTLDVRTWMSLNARVQFVLLYTIPSAPFSLAVDDVIAAAAALPVGEAAGLPLHRFPLERTADAHDAVESGVVGKVLIDVDPSLEGR